MRKENFRKRI